MTLKSSVEVGCEHSSPPSPLREAINEIKLCEGDLLIVRRMLGQVEKDLEPSQIENIFILDASLEIKYAL